MVEGSDQLRVFQYSGRVSPRLLWVGAFYLLLAGVFGFFYQWLLDLNPLILLSPLLTILFGLLLGGVGVACLKLGAVRNRWIALTVLGLLFLGFYGVAFAVALGVGDPGWEGFEAALHAKFSQGDPIPGGNDMVSPGVLGIAYGAELFLLILGGFGLPLTWWKTAVFDEERGAFLPRERLGCRFGVSPETFKAMVRDQGLVAITDPALRTFAENGEEGELRFFVHRSGNGAYLSVLWRGRIRGPSGRTLVREWTLLRRVCIDPQVLESFEKKSLG